MLVYTKSVIVYFPSVRSISVHYIIFLCNVENQVKKMLTRYKKVLNLKELIASPAF